MRASCHLTAVQNHQSPKLATQKKNSQTHIILYISTSTVTTISVIWWFEQKKTRNEIGWFCSDAPPEYLHHLNGDQRWGKHGAMCVVLKTAHTKYIFFNTKKIQDKQTTSTHNELQTKFAALMKFLLNVRDDHVRGMQHDEPITKIQKRLKHETKRVFCDLYVDRAININPCTVVEVKRQKGNI